MVPDVGRRTASVPHFAQARHLSKRPAAELEVEQLGWLDHVYAEIRAFEGTAQWPNVGAFVWCMNLGGRGDGRAEPRGATRIRSLPVVVSFLSSPVRVGVLRSKSKKTCQYGVFIT